jgi:hypothetical protein
MALLPKLQVVTTDDENNKKKMPSTLFAKEIERLQRLQWENEGKNNAEKKTKGEEESESNNESSPTAAAAADDDDVGAVAPSPAPLAVASTSSEATTTISVTEAATTETETAGVDTNPAPPAPPLPLVVEDEVRIIEEVEQPLLNQNMRMRHRQDDGGPNDPSWMYDPLLNLMMLLLAVICYLLLHKFQELTQELRALQQEGY